MPHIGNAISNLDMFSGGWAGPSVPKGYCFLFLNESTGDIWVKYKDSGSVQRIAVIGNYSPGNVASYGASAPATILKTEYWFQVNEAKTELDFYYKDSAGAMHGPLPVSSYGPGNLAIFTGAPPTTVADYDSWFVVNETGGILNWYYKDSGGTVHGPIDIGTYTSTGAWTTYTPSWSSSVGGDVLSTIQGSYIQTAKTVNLQIVASWFVSSSPTTVTYTIGLPVSSNTGIFPQFIYPTFFNPSVIARIYQSRTLGTTFTVLVDTIGHGSTIFFRFNGSYQSI